MRRSFGKFALGFRLLAYMCGIGGGAACAIILLSIYYTDDPLGLRLHRIAPYLMFGGGLCFLGALFASLQLRASVYRSGFRAAKIGSILALILGIGASEIVLRTRLPAWPLIALHGVPAERGLAGWARILQIKPEVIAFNSWGQRDKERTLQPQTERTRVAFVGDSYLEESVDTPIPLLVESQTENKLEVLNLGVSTSSPAEYYWRIKNVALPLGAKKIVVFFFAGNDFIAQPYNSYRKLAKLMLDRLLAPEPVETPLGRILPGWRQFLSMNHRPVVRGLLRGDGIHATELRLLEEARSAGLAGLPAWLASLAEKKNDPELISRLRTLDLSRFYQSLANPDKGLFRSHTIAQFTEAFRTHTTSIDPIDSASFEYTLDWLRASADVCRANNVSLSVVLIPTPFEADPRVSELWSTFLDVHQFFAQRSVDMAKLKSALSTANIPTIDLYDDLMGHPGTYLNFDSHWSDLGNSLAAERIARALRDSM